MNTDASKECIISDSTSPPIPTQETGWLPLGLLPPRLYLFCRRRHRPTIAQRPRTASPGAYRLPDCVRNTTRSHRNQRWRRDPQASCGSYCCCRTAHQSLSNGHGDLGNHDRTSAHRTAYNACRCICGCVLHCRRMLLLHQSRLPPSIY